MGISGPGGQNNPVCATLTTGGGWLCLLFVGLPLAACQGGSNAHANGSQADTAPHLSGGLVQLPIEGFNYTGRTISSFYVDGAWAGNLFVSDQTTGGGKSACCVAWYDLLHRELPKPYKIRWIADMCTYQIEVGDSKEMFTQHRSLWKEEVVLLTELPSERPEAFQVHFYPEGHVAVAMGEAGAKPRLDLPYDPDTGRRPGVADWPRCSDEQMQTYSE